MIYLTATTIWDKQGLGNPIRFRQSIFQEATRWRKEYTKTEYGKGCTKETVIIFPKKRSQKLFTVIGVETSISGRSPGILLCLQEHDACSPHWRLWKKSLHQTHIGDKRRGYLFSIHFIHTYVHICSQASRISFIPLWLDNVWKC